MENKKKNIILVVVVVCCVLLSFGVGFFVGFNSVDKTNNDSENTKEDVCSGDDVYGYALMSYVPGDGSFKEYYKIVELHKECEDKILVSYDADDTVGNVNRVHGIKIVDNKFYYQLYYNTSLATYNNIMYIDLNSNDKKPVEHLKWEKAKYNETIANYKINGDYVYFNSLDNKFYEFNTKSDKYSSITKDQYDAVVEKQYINNEMIRKDILYVNGKELVNDIDKKEVIYDGEVIYSGTATLFYSFDNDIVIQVMSDCGGYGCDTIKYYKYNFDSKMMDEVEITKNQIYTKYVIYK